MARLIGKQFWNRFILNVRLIQQPLRYHHLFIQQQQQQQNQIRQPLMPLICRTFASYGEDLPPIDPKEVELRVFKTISTHDKIDPKNVKITSHLTNDLGLDSLDQVEIMVALEDEFEITIDDVDAEKIHTVQEIINFVIKSLDRPDPRQNPGAKYDPNMEFGPN
ncbi:acyl carrier protein, mitochondrial-like [Dermatophagoides pteronyssinus]|uniref:Acyl carrier protein n=1 Tax=Dermatophagoides pteronyssinus TaxID=6956 RepID=A0A6P6Y8E9_DERPT|nr:acyl carrier protein, mitochondrial-like [Dermatophagoides pteronyssinus]